MSKNNNTKYETSLIHFLHKYMVFMVITCDTWLDGRWKIPPRSPYLALPYKSVVILYFMNLTNRLLIIYDIYKNSMIFTQIITISAIFY